MKHLPIKICAAAIAITGVSTANAAETRISATGAQAELCDVDGIKTLHSGTGYAVESFASRNTTPSIVVSLNGKQCYFDLVAGEGSGFNVKYNGVTYHTQRPQYIPTFFFKPATTATKYSFRISAAGTYDIDWGDGAIQRIDKPDAADTVYSHNYARAANTYEISLGGRATAYSTEPTTAAISFYDGVCPDPEDIECDSSYGLSSMRGCLGCVFSTLTGGTSRVPRFYSTFAFNTKLASEIPAELFSGVNGATTTRMFQRTFLQCGKLTGDIPSGLFSGLSGAPQYSMFQDTFMGCRGLTGSIPADLFVGIRGAPDGNMFWRTFRDCSGLTGSIPATLFAGIEGAPAAGMYAATFKGCRNLSGEIPSGLFGKLKGAPARQMFNSTFLNCSGLTGSIPADLFAGISGEPQALMFIATFGGCTGLTGTIPADLFSGISATGEYQEDMFNNTFNYCAGLSGPSAQIGGRYLYEIWTPEKAQGTYNGDTKLSDYDCIPGVWGGAGTKNPGECGE